jgi:hypothetical protein
MTKLVPVSFELDFEFELGFAYILRHALENKIARPRMGKLKKINPSTSLMLKSQTP